ncbi:hypothetical protein F4680DRAFT_466039 [Xylaria scruposa]|nr:hypothetical protein F4680DRAFT_466039 [Xylaria scruposa]
MSTSKETGSEEGSVRYVAWRGCEERMIAPKDCTNKVLSRDVDYAKMWYFLSNTFGAGEFEIHMIRTVYCIQAPRKLSKDEVAQFLKG